MESIWSKSIEFKERESLNAHIEADAVVIGAGMAGVLIAYFLQKNGINTVVLEANKIASGQTKNTTAKITSQHGLKYMGLIEKHGKEKAKQYAVANEKAIIEYKNLINELNIECEFEECSSYIYTMKDSNLLKEELKAALSLGIKAEYTEETTLPFKVKGAVKFNNQAQFHPLKFINALTENLTIYENSMVREVDKERIYAAKGSVKSKYIIISTHFPFINSPGYYFMRMHQERSYAIALENATKLNGMYLSVDTELFSFRNSGEILILGGGNHRTGAKNSQGKYEALRKAAEKFYPDSKVIASWSAQDCITLDKVPYIGKFSSATPNMYVATGFHKWGMTSSMVSAMLISDEILDRKNMCTEVFSPQRFTPTASAKSLLQDVGTSIERIAAEMISIPDHKYAQIKNNSGEIVELDGEKFGVYKDKNGNIFAVSTKCPHLGCQLEWNQNELSWDCPCHGSRFDYKGILLNNPALKGLENKQKQY